MNGETRPNETAALAPESEASLRRIHRHIYAVILVAALAGLFFSGARMAAGVLLGGALSIFNERWLRASTGAILGKAAATGRVPSWIASKFILRYAVIMIAAGAALRIGYFHVLGIGIGLASYVAAIMIEAGYQGYLTFRSGEGKEE